MAGSSQLQYLMYQDTPLAAQEPAVAAVVLDQQFQEGADFPVGQGHTSRRQTETGGTHVVDIDAIHGFLPS
jgi:hypothetical protein